MSKPKKISIATGIIVILLAISAYFFFPITPFSSLKTADIEAIHVYAVPPEQEILLSQEEIQEAAELLQEVKVYQPGYLSGSIIGQAVKFTIIKADGTTVEIATVGNMAASISGVSYRAEYSSAEALNSFANDVLYSSTETRNSFANNASE